ncbi:Kelch motif family protein [Brugia malayi]|uniref:Bm6347 n=3 Tax=Brugia TaxID=6278 RepID=A0A0K0JMS5_BRUMA|nr:Kelch motif family protein [Brugia malayi]CRZ22907.1 Bm6347 [Brugia malayi]VIO89787.1 Kelch motif family protein [Brugia malayi]
MHACASFLKTTILYFCNTHRTFSMLCTPAAERNKQPILDILKQYIDNQSRTLLEIASGSGQHVCYFAPHFPNVLFQPSDMDDRYVKSINLYIDHFKLCNVKQALKIDVRNDISSWNLPIEFQPEQIDYLLSINMIHISSNAAVDALFKRAGSLLSSKHGLLITYGPYATNGEITPQSNIDFHRSLLSTNPEWGLRDINLLNEKAAISGLYVQKVHDMPANNKMIIFGRQPVS